VVVITAATAHGKVMFYAMASGAAIGIGSIQAVSRSFMAQISPPEKESEFFGFYVLSGKFASMFGPMIFGVISNLTSNQRVAILSLLPFFLAGLVIMFRIDESRALRDAAPSSPTHST
jgi:UMF1 family MFS transporter